MGQTLEFLLQGLFERALNQPANQPGQVLGLFVDEASPVPKATPPLLTKAQFAAIRLVDMLTEHGSTIPCKFSQCLIHTLHLPWCIHFIHLCVMQG